MRFSRRLNMALAMAFLALPSLLAAPVAAQDFPSRIIRVVVAFPPGGPTDFVARLLADKLKASLGQNVIIENKPGANGAIGADYVAKGEADGHLLFLTTVGAVAITPHLSKPNYDSLRGAGLDRSSRRPGAGAVRRHAGAAAAHPGRQAQADRGSLGEPQSAAAGRGHARRAGLCRYHGRQLVRTFGAGQDAARRGREAARCGGRRHQRT